MPDNISKLIQAALTEDVGEGDLTSNITIDEDARCEARLIAKQDGVLSGIQVFHRTFDLVDAALDDFNQALQLDRDDTCGRFDLMTTHADAPQMGQRDSQTDGAVTAHAQNSIHVEKDHARYA